MAVLCPTAVARAPRADFWHHPVCDLPRPLAHAQPHPGGDVVMNSRFIMTVAMLIIFTVMVAIGSRYPAGARFMIFVVGFPAIGLCLLQLFLDFRESRNAARGPSDEIPTTLPEAAAMQMNMTGAGLTVEAYTPEVVRRELIVWGY